jgi:outer membrane lipoprotein-sorting protein
MDRRHFLAALAAVGAASATLSFGIPARADDVSDALAKIARARASLKTLTVPFTQERTIGLLASTVKSEGELTMVRPDKLRWELKAPDAVTYWITPEGFSYATASGGASVGKAAAARFAAVLGDLTALCGGDLESLRKRYDLSVPSTSDGIVLLASPKADDVKKHIKSLELLTTPDLADLRRITIEEKNGDRSVITFGKAVRDAAVDPAKMAPPPK